MDQVQTIRYLVVKERRSIRSVAKEFGIGRNAIRRYIRGAEVGKRKKGHRPAPVLNKVRTRIDEILADSRRWTQGKQKLTAVRLHEMLKTEGFSVGKTLVTEYVAEWKRTQREVYVPLVHAAGDSAQVDFFEVFIDLQGIRRKAYLFVMRLMFSGRDFCWIYERQDQLSFLDGHQRAFSLFGGVPARAVYDNLKAAVKRIIGAERQLSEKFAALMAHYGFEPCFARPGEGHDKGGVESRGKSIRWNHLVPIPVGNNLEEINQRLADRLDRNYNRERFAEELKHLRPAPTPFLVCNARIVWTGRQSLVRLEGAVYSVPSAWARLDITARLYPDKVEFIYNSEVVSHERKRAGERSIDYRHYLRELSRKPQALRQVAPQLLMTLGEPFKAGYEKLVRLHGPREAPRLFGEILRLIESLGWETVSRRLTEALQKDRPLLFTIRGRNNQIPPGAIPESMRIDVVSARASDYDCLLGGAR